MNSKVLDSGYLLVAPSVSTSQQEFLKIVAIITMLIAHISATFADGNMFFYGIGRVAFPLFAFLMVYNYFHHTSSPIKYILRILIIAIVAQAPYALTIGLDSPQVNIMFTLAAGLTIIYMLDRLAKTDNKLMQYGIGYFIGTFFLTAGMFVDYIWLGLIVIIAFWAWIKHPSHITMSIAIVSVFFLNLPSGLMMSFSGLVAFAFIAIALSFNMKINRLNKWGYYSFYPLHLAILQFFS